MTRCGAGTGAPDVDVLGLSEWRYLFGKPSGWEQSVGEACFAETVIRVENVVRDRLLDGVVALGVFDNSVSVAQEHVDDAMRAKLGQIFRQGDRLRAATDGEFRPQLATGGIGATLLIRTEDQDDGCDGEPVIGE